MATRLMCIHLPCCAALPPAILLSRQSSPQRPHQLHRRPRIPEAAHSSAYLLHAGRGVVWHVLRGLEAIANHICSTIKEYGQYCTVCSTGQAGLNTLTGSEHLSSWGPFLCCHNLFGCRMRREGAAGRARPLAVPNLAKIARLLTEALVQQLLACCVTRGGLHGALAKRAAVGQPARVS